MTRTTPGAADDIQFTPRQAEVLALLAQGLTNKEIAYRLGIRESTVEYHVGNILRRLRVDSRYKAGVWAIQHGLAEPSE